jgi:hypothetical protein
MNDHCWHTNDIQCLTHFLHLQLSLSAYRGMMDTNKYNLDNWYGKSLTAGPGQLSSLFASLCGEVIRYQFGQLQSELA